MANRKCDNRNILLLKYIHWEREEEEEEKIR